MYAAVRQKPEHTRNGQHEHDAASAPNHDGTRGNCRVPIVVHLFSMVAVRMAMVRATRAQAIASDACMGRAIVVGVGRATQRMRMLGTSPGGISRMGMVGESAPIVRRRRAAGKGDKALWFGMWNRQGR
mmetsp:Transcript_13722/g.38631  ORF Transcript_13722/g.38631 Transcript_13722/m.38631 type:complete len:129 (-) Transcript_13722:105-491(-)